MHRGFDLAISGHAVRSGVQSKLRGSAKPLTTVLDASSHGRFLRMPGSPGTIFRFREHTPSTCPSL